MDVSRHRSAEAIESIWIETGSGERERWTYNNRYNKIRFTFFDKSTIAAFGAVVLHVLENRPRDNTT